MKRNNDEGETNIENKMQPQLPHDLITEILLRLPVKSLIRFKSVCKSWLSLISHPHFATSHFNLITVERTQRIIFIATHASEARSIDFQTFLYDAAATASLTDDYLVILGSYDPDAPDATNVLTHLEFFSLRANTWKEIEGAHLPYTNSSNHPSVGTLFNGAIHWLACRANMVKVILAFDLTERRISEISLPIDSDFYHVPADRDLWIFGGFMSMWAIGYNTVEIWVMKDYGVHSSWTKTLDMTIDPHRYFSPIFSTNCGDIVGYGITGFVKYNDNGQLLEHRSYRDHPHESQVAIYTESLLPLPLPQA